jgi:peptidyl-prolyl cis-trans isomerase C
MIRINGATIDETAIAAEMQFHPAASHETAQQKAALALALRRLLLDEAERLGIAAEGDDATIGTLLRSELRLPVADEGACRRYYEANRSRFSSADLYEGAHILIAAAPDDAESRAAARRRAEELLSRILVAPKSFAALAAEHSACPSGKNGGRLGQLERGDTIDELETFLFNLAEGEICPRPIETRYGFHLIRLDRKLAGRELPFDAVKDEIAAYLMAMVERRAVAQYLRILAGRAHIEGIDLDQAETPLVQ